MRGNHFVTLDGLRVVAAIAVLLFHRRWEGPGGHLLDHAYLAVDFFFALSGLVIAHAYQRRLQQGMSLFEFVWIRIIRLAPLLILGGLIGGALWVYRGHLYPRALVAIAFNMFALPTPVAPAAHVPKLLFPINGPAWSLMFEIAMNVAFAAGIRFVTRPVLLTIMTISMMCLAFVDQPFYNFGVFSDTFWLGIPRTLFSFSLGVLIYDLYSEGRLPHLPGGVIILSIALVAVFSLNFNWPVQDRLIEIICLTVVFPIILIAGVQNQPTGMWANLAELGGALSYPIYILHQPVLGWWETLRLPKGFIALGLRAALIIGLSYIALRLVDEPMRRLLKRMRLLRLPKPVKTAPGDATPHYGK
jgi:peptidoglycan/LPS O-acetylase OafA/YrhL